MVTRAPRAGRVLPLHGPLQCAELLVHLCIETQDGQQGNPQLAAWQLATQKHVQVRRVSPDSEDPTSKNDPGGLLMTTLTAGGRKSSRNPVYGGVVSDAMPTGPPVSLSINIPR